MVQVTAMNTFYDPSRRWRELRAVAESMQSDVFRFRTRTGLFGVNRTDIRGPEQMFLRKIQSSRIAVVQLAGLTESAFARDYPSGVYRHGQHQASTANNQQKSKTKTKRLLFLPFFVVLARRRPEDGFLLRVPCVLALPCFCVCELAGRRPRSRCPHQAPRL